MNDHTHNHEPAELFTTEVPISELRPGDRFVHSSVYRHDRGTHNTIYEVTEATGSNENGWLFVRKETESPPELQEDGSWSNEGFFSYPPDTTTMQRICSDAERQQLEQAAATAAAQIRADAALDDLAPPAESHESTAQHAKCQSDTDDDAREATR
jgi:hypothetical protein